MAHDAEHDIHPDRHGLADAVALSWVREETVTGRARRTRERARLSQRELARGVGVAVATLQSWEQSRRAPRGAPALRYAALLRALARVSAEMELTA
ncbi:MAG: transcriptional regulator [Pseudonocardiales bacterium]|nr:MAG: transcriptional regulator [Pseudonocardiales bacterium]